ncbi:MAG: sterol desaturase family protein, partial [Polyangiales bacterium]
MDERYIAAAVPVFFLLIGLELLLTRRSRDPRYAFGDSITNLSCGVGSQVLGVFLTGLVVGGYVLVYEHLRVATLSPRSLAAWVAILFALDICYYAFHRASHRVNVLWAMHVVHHQSEEYNLSVALRQSWFDPVLQWVFYLPLAVVDFPPVMYLTMTTLNTLYQFWIHTRAVGRLGPLEWLLNTPSHHRVHHGVNPKYIDKNYAGIFIIWDRLFGTFQREEEEPVYGTVKPLASFNPLWANLEHWGTMARLAARSSSILEKLTVWARPPEWLPRELGGVATIPEASREGQQRYAPAYSAGMRRYVLANYVLVVIAATAFLLVNHSLTPLLLGLYAVLVLTTLVSLGGLLESKPWARMVEAARLPALFVLVALILRDGRRFVAGTVAAGSITLT